MLGVVLAGIIALDMRTGWATFIGVVTALCWWGYQARSLYRERPKYSLRENLKAVLPLMLVWLPVALVLGRCAGTSSVLR
jgi:hypothetical protein